MIFGCIYSITCKGYLAKWARNQTLVPKFKKVEAVDVRSKNIERNEIFRMSREHTMKDPNEHKDFSRPRLREDQELHDSESEELHHQRSVRQKTYTEKMIDIPERSLQ